MEPLIYQVLTQSHWLEHYLCSWAQKLKRSTFLQILLQRELQYLQARLAIVQISLVVTVQRSPQVIQPIKPMLVSTPQAPQAISPSNHNLEAQSSHGKKYSSLTQQYNHYPLTSKNPPRPLFSTLVF